MKEHPSNHEQDSYWTHDQQIGEVRLWDRDWSLRLQAHISDEPYARAHDEEIIELTQRRGVRSYVFGQAYLLQPDERVTVQLNREPDPSGHIGKVTDSDWVGMRRLPVGKAQGWYYPFERTIVLWECFLERHYAKQQPQEDVNQQTFWKGCEGFLVEQFPDAMQIVTTHADPMYPTEDYQAFFARVRVSAGQQSSIWQDGSQDMSSRRAPLKHPSVVAL